MKRNRKKKSEEKQRQPTKKHNLQGIVNTSRTKGKAYLDYDKDGNEVKYKSAEELEKVMSDNWIRYCHEYIREWNKTKSYMLAFGSSKATAKCEGWKLHKKPRIQQYINFIKEDYLKTVGLSKTLLLQELKNLLDVDISDFYDDWNNLKSFDQLKQDNPKAFKALKEVSTKTDHRMNSEKELIETKFQKLQLPERLSVIDRIFKAMGWDAAQKVDMNVTNTYDLSQYTEDELTQLLTLARKTQYVDK